MPTVNEISLEKAKQEKKFLIQSTSKSHFIQCNFLKTIIVPNKMTATKRGLREGGYF